MSNVLGPREIAAANAFFDAHQLHDPNRDQANGIQPGNTGPTHRTLSEEETAEMMRAAQCINADAKLDAALSQFGDMFRSFGTEVGQFFEGPPFGGAARQRGGDHLPPM